MRKRSTLAFVWLPLLACGGDDGHHISTIDAKVFKDAPPAACTASTTYGAVTLGSADQQERSYPSKANGSSSLAPYEELAAVLNTDAAPDILFLDFYPNYGAFAGSNNIKTGSFSITGDELDFATCGICPLLGTDFGSAGEVDDYYAIDGSISLTSIGTPNNGSNGGSGWTGTMSGSITGMHMQHVMIDSSAHTTPVGDGCTASVDSLSFTGTLVQEVRFQNGQAVNGYRLKALTNRHY